MLDSSKIKKNCHQENQIKFNLKVEIIALIKPSLISTISRQQTRIISAALIFTFIDLKDYSWEHTALSGNKASCHYKDKIWNIVANENMTIKVDTRGLFLGEYKFNRIIDPVKWFSQIST